MYALCSPSENYKNSTAAQETGSVCDGKRLAGFHSPIDSNRICGKHRLKEAMILHHQAHHSPSDIVLVQNLKGPHRFLLS
mmetsp:Transcript_397/g.642  ORF Transcript_397/g.642 Transcript_397/m.642 type:complete len:80 (-) Transcript_397:123-362(-)